MAKVAEAAEVANVAKGKRQKGEKWKKLQQVEKSAKQNKTSSQSHIKAPEQLSLDLKVKISKSSCEKIYKITKPIHKD